MALFTFRPELHPRNRVGKFIEVLSHMKQGDSVHAGGVTVEKRGGRFRILGRGGVRDAMDAKSAAHVADLHWGKHQTVTGISPGRIVQNPSDPLIRSGYDNPDEHLAKYGQLPHPPASPGVNGRHLTFSDAAAAPPGTRLTDLRGNRWEKISWDHWDKVGAPHNHPDKISNIAISGRFVKDDLVPHPNAPKSPGVGSDPLDTWHSHIEGKFGTEWDTLVADWTDEANRMGADAELGGPPQVMDPGAKTGPGRVTVDQILLDSTGMTQKQIEDKYVGDFAPHSPEWSAGMRAVEDSLSDVVNSWVDAADSSWSPPQSPGVDPKTGLITPNVSEVPTSPPAPPKSPGTPNASEQLQSLAPGESFPTVSGGTIKALPDGEGGYRVTHGGTGASYAVTADGAGKRDPKSVADWAVLMAKDEIPANGFGDKSGGPLTDRAAVAQKLLSLAPGEAFATPPSDEHAGGTVEKLPAGGYRFKTFDGEGNILSSRVVTSAGTMTDDPNGGLPISRSTTDPLVVASDAARSASARGGLLDGKIPATQQFTPGSGDAGVLVDGRFKFGNDRSALHDENASRLAALPLGTTLVAPNGDRITKLEDGRWYNELGYPQIQSLADSEDGGATNMAASVLMTKGHGVSGKGYAKYGADEWVPASEKHQKDAYEQERAATWAAQDVPSPPQSPGDAAERAKWDKWRKEQDWSQKFPQKWSTRQPTHAPTDDDGKSLPNPPESLGTLKDYVFSKDEIDTIEFGLRTLVEKNKLLNPVSKATAQQLSDEMSSDLNGMKSGDEGHYKLSQEQIATAEYGLRVLVEKRPLLNEKTKGIARGLQPRLWDDWKANDAAAKAMPNPPESPGTLLKRVMGKEDPVMGPPITVPLSPGWEPTDDASAEILKAGRTHSPLDRKGVAHRELTQLVNGKTDHIAGVKVTRKKGKWHIGGNRVAATPDEAAHQIHSELKNPSPSHHRHHVIAEAKVGIAAWARVAPPNSQLTEGAWTFTKGEDQRWTPTMFGSQLAGDNRPAVVEAPLSLAEVLDRTGDDLRVRV